MSKTKVTSILKASYIAMVENSVGTRIFQNFYAYIGKRKQDIVKGGQFSCAFYVSSVLYNFSLLKQPHLTVKNTVQDMLRSGWYQMNKPKKGAVIVWEKRLSPSGDIHEHIGFYISSKQAISNSSKKRVPVRHHLTFAPKTSRSYRKITSIFWHPKLKQNSVRSK